jgi:hypothetical protein
MWGTRDGSAKTPGPSDFLSRRHPKTAIKDKTRMSNTFIKLFKAAILGSYFGFLF